MASLYDDLLSGINTGANLGTAAYDLYQGIQNQSYADKMYDLAFGSAAQQDAWASDMANRAETLYWPLEDKQYQYATEDMTALRPSDVANRDYNIQRRDELLGQARTLNPTLDANKVSYINTMAAPITDLQNRWMDTASTDVSQSFDNKRAAGLRQMGQAGINPSSGNMLDYNRTMTQDQAAQTAAARTKAGRAGEAEGLNRQSTLLNMQAGIPLPQYNINPSVTTSTVSSSMGGTGAAATGLANNMNANAQQNFTGAATSLNSMYWNPITTNYMNSLTNRNNAA